MTSSQSGAALAGDAVTVAAVVLAAGRSRRFGDEDKRFALYEGRALLSHAVDAAVRSGASPVVVVVGDGDQAAIEVVLERDRVKGGEIIANPRADHGMGTSVACGIAAIAARTAPGVDACFLALGDMPLVDSGLYARLLDAASAYDFARITVPVSGDGHRGHPVLWPRAWFPRLSVLDGERGAQALLREAEPPPVKLPVDGANANLDIDTADDLARLIDVRRGEMSEPRYAGPKE
ncbi:MAG: nucleotidyltransferase family protein [Pseudomonadota bacterium]